MKKQVWLRRGKTNYIDISMQTLLYHIQADETRMTCATKNGEDPENFPVYLKS